MTRKYTKFHQRSSNGSKVTLNFLSGSIGPGGYRLCYKKKVTIRGLIITAVFALYIDDIVNTVNMLNIGCFLHRACVSIILYADDILLLTPSVSGLQRLFTVVETELLKLGLKINDRKTVCMRIGPHYQVNCASILTLSGKQLEWVHELRYLGVYFVSTVKFKCSFNNCKKSFYRSFNAIFGRIGRKASEETILSLITAKCLPVLLYGLDVCPVNATDKRSLEYTVNRILFKIFRTFDLDIIRECQQYFSFPTVNELILKRKIRFLSNYVALDNSICSTCADVANDELRLLTHLLR